MKHNYAKQFDRQFDNPIGQLDKLIDQTKAVQKIEFRQKLSEFGWELWILSDGREVCLDLTDEEVKWLELDLRKRLGEQ